MAENGTISQVTEQAQQTIKHHRVCNFCEAMCGIEVTLKKNEPSTDEDITGEDIVIKPDKLDPFSKGSMCPKALVMAAQGPCADPHAGCCGGWRLDTSGYPISRQSLHVYT